MSLNISAAFLKIAHKCQHLYRSRDRKVQLQQLRWVGFRMLCFVESRVLILFCTELQAKKGKRRRLGESAVGSGSSLQVWKTERFVNSLDTKKSGASSLKIASEVYAGMPWSGQLLLPGWLSANKLHKSWGKLSKQIWSTDVWLRVTLRCCAAQTDDSTCQESPITISISGGAHFF